MTVEEGRARRLGLVMGVGAIVVFVLIGVLPLVRAF